MGHGKVKGKKGEDMAGAWNWWLKFPPTSALRANHNLTENRKRERERCDSNNKMHIKCRGRKENMQNRSWKTTPKVRSVTNTYKGIIPSSGREDRKIYQQKNTSESKYTVLNQKRSEGNIKRYLKYIQEAWIPKIEKRARHSSWRVPNVSDLRLSLKAGPKDVWYICMDRLSFSPPRTKPT